MDDYGDNYISLTDEDGQDFELQILDEAIVDGVRYFALTESEDPEQEENLEVIIMKLIKDDKTGEELFSTLDSDEELERVYEVFEEQMFGEEDYEDEEE